MPLRQPILEDWPIKHAFCAQVDIVFYTVSLTNYKKLNLSCIVYSPNSLPFISSLWGGCSRRLLCWCVESCFLDLSGFPTAGGAFAPLTRCGDVVAVISWAVAFVCRVMPLQSKVLYCSFCHLRFVYYLNSLFYLLRKTWSFSFFAVDQTGADAWMARSSPCWNYCAFTLWIPFAG